MMKSIIDLFIQKVGGRGETMVGSYPVQYLAIAKQRFIYLPKIVGSRCNRGNQLFSLQCTAPTCTLPLPDQPTLLLARSVDLSREKHYELNLSDCLFESLAVLWITKFTGLGIIVSRNLLHVINNAQQFAINTLSDDWRHILRNINKWLQLCCTGNLKHIH